jgi:hypothetical protein
VPYPEKSLISLQLAGVNPARVIIDSQQVISCRE